MSKPELARPLAPWALWLAALVPIGCALPNETIDGADDGTLFAGVRSSWRLDEPGPEGGEPDRRQTHFELDVSGSRSDFTQQVPAGQAIGVGGTQFLGPADVDVEFDVVRIMGGLRASARNEHGLGLEGLAGLGYHVLDVQLSTAVLSDSDRLRGFGPVLGIGFFYEPTDRVRLFVEGSVNPSVTSDTSDLVDFNTLELGARFRIGERVSLSLAWREVSYRAQNDGFDSDLDLTASGPAVVLSFGW